MTDTTVPALKDAAQKEAFHRLNPASGIQGQTKHFDKKTIYRIKRKKQTHLLLRRKKIAGNQEDVQRLLLSLSEILEILPEVGSTNAHSTKVVVEKLKGLRRHVSTAHGMVQGIFDTMHSQRKEIEFLMEKVKSHDEALCAGIRELSACTAYYRAAPRFNAFSQATVETTDIVVNRNTQTQERE